MPKRLVICCDGTWNSADQDSPTNVVKFAMGVEVGARAGDDFEQRLLYIHGVGSGRLDRLLGGATGWGLSRHILEGYRFLSSSYSPGDEIYLLGFSRGAFTARSLAGLIRTCGIIRPEHTEVIQHGFALYRAGPRRRPSRPPPPGHLSDRRGHPLSTEAIVFRRAYSYTDEVPIRFIGVWDTVGTLGIPLAGRRWINWFNRRWQFHDTDLSRKVQSAYHAVAIDEQRSSFAPSMWRQHPDAPQEQHLEQVWFTGVHSDVGGGNGNQALSDITLLWMVERARAAGVRFVPGYFHPGSEELERAGPSGEPPSETRRLGQWVHPDPGAPTRPCPTRFYARLPHMQRSVGREPRSGPAAPKQWIASPAYERARSEAAIGGAPWLHEAEKAGVPLMHVPLPAISSAEAPSSVRHPADRRATQ